RQRGQERGEVLAGLAEPRFLERLAEGRGIDPAAGRHARLVYERLDLAPALGDRSQDGLVGTPLVHAAGDARRQQPGERPAVERACLSGPDELVARYAETEFHQVPIQEGKGPLDGRVPQVV